MIKSYKISSYYLLYLSQIFTEKLLYQSVFIPYKLNVTLTANNSKTANVFTVSFVCSLLLDL